jgi:hypothetical protein
MTNPIGRETLDGAVSTFVGMISMAPSMTCAFPNALACQTHVLSTVSI